MWKMKDELVAFRSGIGIVGEVFMKRTQTGQENSLIQGGVSMGSW